MSDAAKLRGLLEANAVVPIVELPVLRRPSSPPENDATPEAAERWREAFERVPKRYRAHTFETVDRFVVDRGAIAEAQAAGAVLLAGELLAITFHGKTGSGKTTLAAALLDWLCARAAEGSTPARRLVRSALWLDALELSQARRGHKLGDGDAPLVERAHAAPLLILDDVGQETTSGSDEVIDVLWRRHQAELPTIVTTGQPSRKLVFRYGSGVVKRITVPARGARAIRCGEDERDEEQPKQLELPGGRTA